MPITHEFVSEKSDSEDSTLVRPSDWNADHIEIGGWTTVVVKSTDETVTNSSTLQNDDELLFEGLANELWLVEVDIGYTATINGDFKCDLGISTGNAQWNGWYFGQNTSNTAMSSQFNDGTASSCTDIAAGGGSTGVIRGLYIKCFVRLDNNGTVSFRFAQNSAQTSESAVCKAGSTLRARKIA